MNLTKNIYGKSTITIINGTTGASIVGQVVKPPLVMLASCEPWIEYLLFHYQCNRNECLVGMGDPKHTSVFNQFLTEVSGPLSWERIFFKQ